MTPSILIPLVVIIVVLAVVVAVLLWRLLKNGDELRRKNDVIIREVEKNAHLQDELRDALRRAGHAAVLGIASLLMLTLTSCGKDDDDDGTDPADAAPGVEVCVVFAPNELGDCGYADRVLAGIHLFDQQLSKGDYNRVQLRYVAVADTDAIRTELLRWDQQGTSPYNRLAYERRLLVLTDRSLLHCLAYTPLSETDEVLVMNVAEQYFLQTPKADWLGQRLHLLNVSAAEAARKFCRRIDSETTADSGRQREIRLLQGREKAEVLADSISQAAREYFGDNISVQIYTTEILGTGNEAFNNAFIMGSVVRNASYAICNWASLNAALFANLYLEGSDDAEVVFLDTEIDESSRWFPTIVRHYDRALCQWLERWLVAPVTRRLFARIATGKRGSARIARLLY